MKHLAMALIALCIPAQMTFAADTAGKKMPSMTHEQRQKMADLHEKMASCLRSDKSVDDCHQEMRKSCEEMGKDACPMMGHHDHDHGHDKKKGA